MKVYYRSTVLIICISIAQKTYADEFIERHTVPSEIKAVLDQHTEELNEIMVACRKRKHCPARRAVKEFPWLPGYFVKYGVGRVRGADLLQSIIEKHGFSNVMVPKKYLYHIKGRPAILGSSNYLIIAEKVYVDDHHQISEDMVKEFLVLISEAQMKDHHSNNVLVTADGKMAMIDTGKESFYPYWLWRKKTQYSDIDLLNSMALLIDKHGKFLKKGMVSEEAYQYVVRALAEFIKKQTDKTLFKEKVQEHLQYVKKLKNWPWDYLGPFRVNDLIEGSSDQENVLEKKNNSPN